MYDLAHGCGDRARHVLFRHRNSHARHYIIAQFCGSSANSARGATRISILEGRGASYCHMPRIFAPTSILICRALRSLAAAETFGQLVVSKNCNSVAGMNRVREA